MKEVNYALIGFGVGILLLLALYFFWHIPEVDKSYKKGLAECREKIDTVFLPGKPVIEYRDTTIYIEKPVEVDTSDSTVTLKTSNKNLFVSGKDTITTNPSVEITINKKDGDWQTEKIKADWTETIKHKDFKQTADTIKITTPEFIPVVEKETNWLVSGIAYILGIASAITIFFLAK